MDATLQSMDPELQATVGKVLRSPVCPRFRFCSGGNPYFFKETGEDSRSLFPGFVVDKA